MGFHDGLCQETNQRGMVIGMTAIDPEPTCSGWLYSITSSARPSSGSGTVRPNALAVLRFRINSTFVACCTVVSPRLWPFRW
jgi:hypothetical protein